jgi:hypothetical protein
MMYSLFQYYLFAPVIIAGFEKVLGVLLTIEAECKRKKGGFPRP